MLDNQELNVEVNVGDTILNDGMLREMYMRMIVLRLDFHDVCRSLYMLYDTRGMMDPDEKFVYTRLCGFFNFGKCSIFCDNQPTVILWRMNNSGTIDQAVSCKRCYKSNKPLKGNLYIRKEVQRKCMIMKAANFPARELCENSLMSVAGMYKVEFLFNIVAVSEH